MAANSETLYQTRSQENTQPIGGLRYDTVMTGLLFIFLSGLFLDGWGHFHGQVDESFFTPWHAVFYGGFALTAGYLVFGLVVNRVRGFRGRSAVPAGYDLALLGAVVFAGGGVGDMVWHNLFGVENSTEALMSTSHIILAIGMFLMLSGPFRAAWLRVGKPANLWAQLPGVISLAFTLTGFSFITSYVNTATNPFAARNYQPFSGEVRNFFNPALGLGSVMLTTALLMGLVFLAIRRRRLMPGTLTIVFSTTIVYMSLLQDEFRLIPAWVLAGVIGDFLYAWLKPAVENPSGLRRFAFLLPAAAYSLYFLALQLTGGIWWRIHTWSGAIAYAGITGLFLSYLLVPPAVPVEPK